MHTLWNSGIILAIVFIAGCRDSAVSSTPIDTPLFELNSAMTVSELASTDALFKKVEVKLATPDTFSVLPSCSCICLHEPKPTNEIVSFSNSQSISPRLILKHTQQAGEHSLTFNGKDSKHVFRVNWTFNILDDISIAPSIVQVSNEDATGDKKTIRVSLRSGDRNELDHFRIRPAESKFLKSFSAKQRGEPFEELPGLFCQEWDCLVRIVGDELDQDTNVLEIEAFRGDSKDSSFAANLMVKAERTEIAFPQEINFGTVASHNESIKRFRLGRLGGPKFKVSKISPSCKWIDVEWKGLDDLTDNCWVTLEIHPIETGDFSEELVISTESNKELSIKVVGRTEK